MSQKRQGVFTLQGEFVKTPECVVVESSPEIKRNKLANDLTCVKEQKIIKSGVQPVEKKQQWVSSSFHGFTHQPITKLVSEKSNRKCRSRSKDNAGKEAKPITPSTEPGVLWCEKYCPLSEADLAVHKKKIAEVRDWLLAHLCSQTGSAILLLTGPPGSGKTATVQVLVKEIGVEIQEWVNPLNPFVQNDLVESDWRNYEDMVRPESQLKRFQNFFLRANKYPCLSLGSSDVNQGKKIILIEDMPNLFYRNAAELHDLLSHYARSGRNPVVFIVSDSSSNDTNAYRLFPKDVIQMLAISTISFNPASVTSLNKVANKIVSIEAQKRNLAFQAPSKEIIDALVSGSNGDIRGMINNLQFSCLKGCSSTFQKQKHSKRSRPTRESKSQSEKSSSKKSGKNESSSVSMIGGKDTSLFLFRVLGKILYCKREENCSTSMNSLPLHLKHHERRPLLENPENVFEKCHMSGENLTLYLHQNYMDFFNNVDDVSIACDYLSDADHLTAEWMHRSTLSEYTPCLAIRGLMFCNQGRSATGWRPLHKPQWYSVLKKRRNNIATAMELFQEYTRNTAQLHCEIIPYLALSGVPLLSPGQKTYIQSNLRFSKSTLALRDPNSTLLEKEIDDEETEMRYSQPQCNQVHVRPHGIKALTQTPLMDEEDDIEEFEDD